MRQGGPEGSWRFAEGIEQLPHVSVFVRDALGFDLGDDEACPPRLAGPVPDLRARLDRSLRGPASERWATWWQAVVSHQARMLLGDQSGDRRQWVQRLIAEGRRTVDPPEWRSLADRPALRAAVQAAFEDGRRWADENRTPLIPPNGAACFTWETTREVATAVAAQEGVLPRAVNGCALVLLTEGLWWRRFAPGVVLCSMEAAREPAVSRVILTEAFVSHIRSGSS